MRTNDHIRQLWLTNNIIYYRLINSKSFIQPRTKSVDSVYFFSRSHRIQLHLEIGLLQLHYYQYKDANENFEAAFSISGISCDLDGEALRTLSCVSESDWRNNCRCAWGQNKVSTKARRTIEGANRAKRRGGRDFHSRVHKSRYSKGEFQFTLIWYFSIYLSTDKSLRFTWQFELYCYWFWFSKMIGMRTVHSYAVTKQHYTCTKCSFVFDAIAVINSERLKGAPQHVKLCQEWNAVRGCVGLIH